MLRVLRLQSGKTGPMHALKVVTDSRQDRLHLCLKWGNLNAQKAHFWQDCSSVCFLLLANFSSACCCCIRLDEFACAASSSSIAVLAQPEAVTSLTLETTFPQHGTRRRHKKTDHPVTRCPFFRYIRYVLQHAAVVLHKGCQMKIK
jgi:hypothetical protein